MPVSGSQQKGTKSEVATSSMPCQGPKTKAELLCNYCVVGVTPGKRDNIKIATLMPLFSRGQKRAESLPNPYVLGGGQQRGQNQK